jgi:hypothetical protein
MPRRRKGDDKVGPSGDYLHWDGTIRSKSMRYRIYALQVIATIFLYFMFVVNWAMNPGSFEVRFHSAYLGTVPFLTVGIIGIIVGAIVCVLPSFVRMIETNWRFVFGWEYTRRRGVLMLVVILIILTLLIKPVNVYIIVLQSFIAFFYVAALIFGMYGIWHLKGTHLITAGMFTFFTTISRPKPPSELDLVLVFVFSFLLFMEVSSSAIRQHLLASEELVPVKFQARMVDRYMRYLAIFSTLGLLLTYIVLKGRYMVNYLSPVWSVEAIEVQGYLGLILPALMLILTVWVVRYVYNLIRGDTIKPIEDEDEEDKKRGYFERFLVSYRVKS